MIKIVNSVIPGGKTNFEAGFQKTFEVFENTEDQEFGS